MKRLLLLALAVFALDGFAFAKTIRRLGNDVAVQKGLVRMETVGASGAVLLYVVNGKKIYPAVETSGYGESNYISLYDGSREYRLNKKEGCEYHFEVEENSISEFFKIPGLAELKAVYEISKMDPEDEIENSITVKYTLKNISGQKKPLTLKAVYNTRLGENRRAHYSTALKSDIGSEYVARPSAEESWIISSDSENAIEFIIHGQGVTPPKRAVLANKDALERAAPDAVFNPGNSFDSLLSYNNSSLGLFWNPVELSEENAAVYSYKINFSVSDFQNSGKLRAEPPKKQEAEPEAAAKEEEPKTEDAKKEEPAQGQLAAEVEYVDPSKLNAEYVQQLINHINSLEQSDPSLNRLKIQQLQTEVDEVLQVLRSRK